MDRELVVWCARATHMNEGGTRGRWTMLNCFSSLPIRHIRSHFPGVFCLPAISGSALACILWLIPAHVTVQRPGRPL